MNDVTTETPLPLEPGEQVQVVARTDSARLALTDQRLIVVVDDRVTLRVPFEGLRRIQFDVERTRPATLVIVPERPSDEPQVLAPPQSHPLRLPE